MSLDYCIPYNIVNKPVFCMIPQLCAILHGRQVICCHYFSFFQEFKMYRGLRSRQEFLKPRLPPCTVLPLISLCRQKLSDVELFFRHSLFGNRLKVCKSFLGHWSNASFHDRGEPRYGVVVYARKKSINQWNERLDRFFFVRYRA